MTARYEMLIRSMQETNDAVMLIAVFAIVLLLARLAVRRIVDAPIMPVFFKTLMYNAGDVLLLLPIYALIIISQ